MKPRVLDLAVVPNLTQRMIDTCATIVSLSEQSGLSEALINKAKRGEPIRRSNAEVLDITLRERKFTKKVGKHFKYLTFKGERLLVAEWSKRTGIPPKRINDRISQYGFSVQQALTVGYGQQRRML